MIQKYPLNFNRINSFEVFSVCIILIFYLLYCARRDACVNAKPMIYIMIYITIAIITYISSVSRSHTRPGEHITLLELFYALYALSTVYYL